jgi:integrase
MIQNGESLVYVKDQAGHSSIKVTVDRYGKLVPGENRDAMDRLGESLKKPATPAQPKQVRSSNIQGIQGNI